jgi:hypothetical protein
MSGGNTEGDGSEDGRSVERTMGGVVILRAMMVKTVGRWKGLRVVVMLRAMVVKTIGRSVVAMAMGGVVILRAMMVKVARATSGGNTEGDGGEGTERMCVIAIAGRRRQVDGGDCVVVR